MNNFDTIHNRRGTGSLKWDKFPELDPLWVADMDFQSPHAVIEALQSRVNAGIFGYAIPHQGLVDSVLAYLARVHETEAEESDLVHLGGLVPALSLATKAFANPGDALMTCTPIYPPFIGVHKDHGLDLIALPHSQNDEGVWGFDWEKMEASVTPKTKLFLLSNPQNPLGRAFTENEVLQLADFCERHDLVLISDEIHCDLILDEKANPHFSAARLPEQYQSRIVTLMAPSKTYNIAGLGYAFAYIACDSLRRKFTAAKGHTLAEINALAYYAAEAAYNEGDEWRQELLTYLSGNRDLLTSQLTEALPKIKIPHIEATYLAWIDVSAYLPKLPAAQIEKETGLYLSEGAYFGHDGHIRINFGCPRSKLQTALDTLINYLSTL